MNPEVHDIVQEAVIKTFPKKKKCKRAKWLSEEALQIAEKRREAKVKGCFGFGFISSFFLKLLLHSSPVAYWAPIDLGSSSFSVISFCLFILFMGFSRQEY